MRRLGILAAAGAALLLTGCAGGGAIYSQPEQLAEKYIEAGGACSNPQDVPESMVGEGASTLLCDDLTFLIVFDSEESKNGYIAAIGDSESAVVGGDRWVAVGEGVSDKAGALGGKVIVEAD